MPTSALTDLAPVPVLLREYCGTDTRSTFEVFRQAIQITAARDYDARQIEAWAGADRDDLSGWDAKRRESFTLVAEADSQVVGFADLAAGNLVDMLFVHPKWSGRGVARALVEGIKTEARARGLLSLTTYASRTARPAFESFGFTVVEERPLNTVRDVVVPNFEMRCEL